ncbi:MAG: penicillin-binding protein, partial [Pseudomonadota bacterium]
MSKRGDGLQNKGKRGSRRAAAERSRAGTTSKRTKSGSKKRGKSKKGGDKEPPSPFWKWTKRLTIWGTASALLAGIFLVFAVGFAARSIPSFYQLKATQNAQTILVRARDGSEIVELGPSFGEWIDHNDIP